jgi:hypothetical protein
MARILLDFCIALGLFLGVGCLNLCYMCVEAWFGSTRTEDSDRTIVLWTSTRRVVLTISKTREKHSPGALSKE